MPHHDVIALSGVVKNVFAHRFTLEADGAVHLADLGPKGLEKFPLSVGLAVELKGEKRPSEIKVTEIAAHGGERIAVEHKKPHHGPGGHHKPEPGLDPAKARCAAESAGWSVRGEPNRKPKHFEVLARKPGGPWSELHIDGAGDIYKTKPLPDDGGKWADLIG